LVENLDHQLPQLILDGTQANIGDAKSRINKYLEDHNFEITFDPYAEQQGSAGLADNLRLALGTKAPAFLGDLGLIAWKRGFLSMRLGTLLIAWPGWQELRQSWAPPA